MNKSTVIVTALVIVSGLSLMYGFVQKVEAQKQQAIALSNMERAVKAMEESENCRIVSQHQMEIANARAAALEAATIDALASIEKERQRAEKASNGKKK
jgi:hypothetical protein